MVRKVIVLPYQGSWAEQFKTAEAELRSLLGEEIIAVHHIGSTAIPHTSAKPILDLMPEVYDISRIDCCSQRMAQAGYRAMGEYGLPGRRFFIKGSDDEHTHHVHIYQSGSPEITRHLAFRDYLNAHREAAQAYGKLKTELAEKHPEDMEAYIQGKDAAVKELERRALTWVQAGRKRL